MCISTCLNVGYTRFICLADEARANRALSRDRNCLCLCLCICLYIYTYIYIYT